MDTLLSDPRFLEQKDLYREIKNLETQGDKLIGKINKAIKKQEEKADTVSKVVLHDFITLPIILAGVTAAIIWNLLTWWLGIPSSSSHTLIGGFAGSAICGAGFQSIHTEVVLKIASFIFLAPIIGMIISSLITILVLWTFRRVNARKAEKAFKRLQLVSAGLFSLGHGLNDSQKVMGIIATAMIAMGTITHVEELPNWVP